MVRLSVVSSEIWKGDRRERERPLTPDWRGGGGGLILLFFLFFVFPHQITNTITSLPPLSLPFYLSLSFSSLLYPSAAADE